MITASTTSKKAIMRAGKIIRDAEDLDSVEYTEAYRILASYRSTFRPYMNAVNKRVRDVLKNHLPHVYAKSDNYIISQREKRL
jgi:hypothetical protein